MSNEKQNLAHAERQPLNMGCVSGSVLSHSEFILSLKNLGFDVMVVGQRDRDYSLRLEVNSIRIPNENYLAFGYCTPSTYVTCGRTDKNEFSLRDIEEAIKICSQVLMSEIVSISKVPTYFDCRDFLNSYGKSKIEKDSIKRTLSILRDNYQQLIKSVVGFQHYR
jgi:hypothetical protein